MKYLANFRSSWETIEEVRKGLEDKFGPVAMFDGGAGEIYFLIETDLNESDVQRWAEDNFPYSLRDFIKVSL